MFSRARTFVAPLYLAACLILGGSAQGVWQNMSLQLGGVVIIAWAALDRGDGALAVQARQLMILTIVGLALVVLQLVPLPPSTWASFGPRARIAQDFHTLGVNLPAMPLSLVPVATLSCLLAFIPPLAIFCAIVRLKAYRPVSLAAAVVAATVLSIALGALQVASASDSGSPWYLFDNTSVGRAVGFFANADHLATLLLVSIPFLAAIPAAARNASFQRYSALMAVTIGTAITIVVGIALNGSLAGYGLVLPVVAASALILLPPASKLRLWVVAAAAVFMAGGLVALESSSIGSSAIGRHADSSVESRTAILHTTMKAAADFMPLGSGLGSFRNVYALYEQPQQVTPVYVIHAHNDYAELFLELGLPGLLLVLAFLIWWSVAVWQVWRSAEGRPFARAAAIASAAVLVHSLVDFPLRTAAIAVVFSMCLALLADGRAAPPKEAKELRRRRHVEFR